MSSASWRTTPLPPDWRSLRVHVLDRDGYRCTMPTSTGRCERWANQVDHIGPNTDHSYVNLRALCEPHHRERTGQQARAAHLLRARRAPEPHPGYVN